MRNTMSAWEAEEVVRELLWDPEPCECCEDDPRCPECGGMLDEDDTCECCGEHYGPVDDDREDFHSDG